MCAVCNQGCCDEGNRSSGSCRPQHGGRQHVQLAALHSVVLCGFCRALTSVLLQGWQLQWRFKLGHALPAVAAGVAARQHQHSCCAFLPSLVSPAAGWTLRLCHCRWLVRFSGRRLQLQQPACCCCNQQGANRMQRQGQARVSFLNILSLLCSDCQLGCFFGRGAGCASDFGGCDRQPRALLPASVRSCAPGVRQRVSLRSSSRSSRATAEGAGLARGAAGVCRH